MSTLPLNPPGVQVTDGSVAPNSRAALISQSLKNVARRARTPRNVWVSSGSVAQRRWQHIFAWAVIAAFGLIVVVPNLVSGIYLAFIASDQYASETRFAVRGGQSNILDPVGGLAGIASPQRMQDSLILSDYVRGASMVASVDRVLDIRHLFSRQGIDTFSRFKPTETNERLLRYWRRHVEVSIDSISGIITVVVRAFTPQDSLDVANQITKLSEKMVNDLSERAREDALRQAKTELALANDNLQKKTTEMRDLRNREGVLDTGKTGEVMTQMLGDLRLELIRLQQEYAAQRRTILPTAPQLQVLSARIESMKGEIRRLEGQMTGSSDKSTGALAEQMGRFDRLRLETDIAEKEYIAAAAAFERARVELETQNVYLATFLQPVLAQEALYPRRLWLWSIVLVISLLIWGSGVGIAVVVRDHLAS
jgi:capsular polysaccharide transport system permease protein